MGQPFAQNATTDYCGSSTTPACLWCAIPRRPSRFGTTCRARAPLGAEPPRWITVLKAECNGTERRLRVTGQVSSPETCYATHATRALGTMRLAQRPSQSGMNGPTPRKGQFVMAQWSDRCLLCVMTRSRSYNLFLLALNSRCPVAQMIQQLVTVPLQQTNLCPTVPLALAASTSVALLVGMMPLSVRTRS